MIYSLVKIDTVPVLGNYNDGRVIIIGRGFITEGVGYVNELT